MNYYRVCPKHRKHLDDDLKCKYEHYGHGHICQTWIIIDDNGVQVGAANEETGGILLLGYFEQEAGQTSKRPEDPNSEMPKTRCRRGHYNWTLKPLDNRWRCRDCNNMKAVERKHHQDKVLAKIKQLTLKLDESTVYQW